MFCAYLQATINCFVGKYSPLCWKWFHRWQNCRDFSLDWIDKKGGRRQLNLVR